MCWSWMRLPCRKTKNLDRRTEVRCQWCPNQRGRGGFPHVFSPVILYPGVIFRTYPGCLHFLRGRASYFSSGDILAVFFNFKLYFIFFSYFSYVLGSFRFISFHVQRWNFLCLIHISRAYGVVFVLSVVLRPNSVPHIRVSLRNPRLFNTIFGETSLRTRNILLFN